LAEHQPPIESHDATLFENPQFQHYEETSNLQLFFDLFFVANLSSFTNAHEINNVQSTLLRAAVVVGCARLTLLAALSSYIGFFCILWFTWCQVTLYDVRFATDSIFERICHACHFGVMVGLAVVGPQFQDPKLTPWDTLQQLSLILMASRAVLLFQYGSTLFFTWRYRRARLPLMAVLASLLIAVVLYLGISFAFSLQSSPNAYIAWYVIAICEVAANIAIAGRWHVVSFKNTHLVERMTCLTLIIVCFSSPMTYKDLLKTPNSWAKVSSVCASRSSRSRTWTSTSALGPSVPLSPPSLPS
jgi:Bacterial low temperature requirement A protein (LtrA)